LLESYESQPKDNKLPLVTVAMPVFNAGKYLKMAVLSIVKQTFTNWELIIIDDGSTDDALQNIADIKDDRILFLKDGINKGLAERLNEAIDMARGQYFARMDQDDVSYPERFEHQIKALQNDPELDMIAVRSIAVSEHDEPIRPCPYKISHKKICARPWQGFYLAHPTWMGKIDWFRKYRYAVPAPFFCEDQELLLRSYSQSKFGSVDEILFGYRIKNKDNWNKLIKTRVTVLKVQVRHFLKAHQAYYCFLAIMIFIGRFFFDLWKSIRKITFMDQPAVDSTISSKWHDVLEKIRDNSDLSDG